MAFIFKAKMSDDFEDDERWNELTESFGSVMGIDEAEQREALGDVNYEKYMAWIVQSNDLEIAMKRAELLLNVAEAQRTASTTSIKNSIAAFIDYTKYVIAAWSIHFFFFKK
jgi:hypothetical protein